MARPPDRTLNRRRHRVPIGPNGEHPFVLAEQWIEHCKAQRLDVDGTPEEEHDCE